MNYSNSYGVLKLCLLTCFSFQLLNRFSFLATKEILANVTSNFSRNIALNAPVCCFTKFGDFLTDGDPKTIALSEPGTWSFFLIDLHAFHNIEKIVIINSKDQGNLDREFSVSIAGDDLNQCNLRENFPWTICKRNIRFTYPQQVIEITCPPLQLKTTPTENATEIGKLSSKGARFVIISTGSPIKSATIYKALSLAEVKVYKKQDSSSYLTNRDIESVIEIEKQFSNDLKEDLPTIPPQVLKARKTFWAGLDSIEFPANGGGFSPDYSRGDAVLLWHKKHAIAITTKVGKSQCFLIGHNHFGRDLFVSENNLNSKTTITKTGDLRLNILSLLSKSPTSVKLIVSDIINTKNTPQGAIILLDQYTKVFSIDEVFNMITSGRNPCIISVAGWIDVPEILLKLMHRLGVSRKQNLANSETIIFFSRDFIFNPQFASASNEVELAANNYHAFTRHLFSFESAYQSVSDTRSFNTIQFKNAAEKLLDRYYNWVVSLAPCVGRPFKAELNSVQRIGLLNYLNVALAQTGPHYKSLPGQFNFPGNFAHDRLQPVSLRVRLQQLFVDEMLATGAYAKPGVEFRYELIEFSGNPADYIVRVGCHSDKLDDLAHWLRWPQVVSSKQLDSINGTFWSPFGGPIYLIGKPGYNYTFILHNVYEYPRFDVRNPITVTNWATGQWADNPTPYMEISGDAIGFCLPTGSLQLLSAQQLVTMTTNIYDRVVKTSINYLGANWRTERPQRFTVDVQPVLGFGHSGYPIVGSLAWMDAFLQLEQVYRQGHWGMCHEVGHNFQRPEYALARTTEVTNNIFCLVVNERVFNVSRFELGEDRGLSEEAQTKVVEYWRVRGQYPDWEMVALFYYAYMNQIFGFGLLGNTMRQYEIERNNPTKESSNTADNNESQDAATKEQQMLDRWLVTLSVEAGHDLRPLHDLFGLPYSGSTIAFSPTVSPTAPMPDWLVADAKHVAKESEAAANIDRKLSALPCIIPDDKVTRQASERVAELLEKYASRKCVRKASQRVGLKADLYDGHFELLPSRVAVIKV